MRKTMKECCRRLMAVAAVVCSMATPASAQEDAYYAFNVHLEAYPAGKGQIYATSDIETALRGYETIEVPEWYSSVNLKFASDWKNVGAWAKPADGYLYAGFRTSKFEFDDNFNYVVARDAKGNVVYGDHKEPNSWIWGLDSDLTLYGSDGLPVASKTDADLAAVQQLIPNEPNNYVQLLFTRVRCSVAEGQAALGSASMLEKYVVNDIGDGIYFRAIPYGQSSFEGWYIDGQLVSRDPYTSTIVKGTAVWEARFSHPLARTVIFPDAGGFVEWYSDYDYELPNMVSIYHPTMAKAKLVEENAGTGWQASLDLRNQGDSIRGKMPSIIYGKGQVTFYPKSENPASYPSGEYFFQYNGNTTTPLLGGCCYYLLSDDGKNLVRTNSTIPAGRVYVELPETTFSHGTPDVIHLYTGLGDVNGDGIVDVGDIMAVINFMAGQTAGIMRSVADVNSDGNVDVGDIMAIINIMASK